MAGRSPTHAGYIVTALVGCTFAMLFNFARADCGGFANTCYSMSVTANGFLLATCRTTSGGFNRASIDLNAHIGNDNGNLVDGHGFIETCKNVRYYNLVGNDQGVAADCKRKDGSLGRTTMYNVQRRVSNNNGNLVWNVCSPHSPLETVVDNSTSVAARKMLGV